MNSFEKALNEYLKLKYYLAGEVVVYENETNKVKLLCCYIESKDNIIKLIEKFGISKDIFIKVVLNKEHPQLKGYRMYFVGITILNKFVFRLKRCDDFKPFVLECENYGSGYVEYWREKK